MRSHRIWTKSTLAALAVAAITSNAAEARAQSVEPGLAVNKFEPSETNNEWFAADTLDLRGKVRPSFGAVLEGQYRPVVVYNGDGSLKWSPVRNVGTLHLGGSVNLLDRVRVGVSLPIVLFQDGHESDLGARRIVAPASDQALGDMRVGVDVRLFGAYGSPITMALGAQLWVPTGSQENYTSDGAARFAPHVTAAGDIGIFTYSAKLGVQIGRPERYFGATKVGQELNFAVAAGVRVLDKHLVVGPEVFGSTVIVSDPSSPNRTGLADDARGQTAIEGLLGAHYTAGMVRFGAGAGFGFTRGIGSPERRWMVGVELVPTVGADADADGIDDTDDACPTTAGVKSDDPRKNGCPSDRDGDGVIDTEDACIDVAGVHTNDAKTNGCPAPKDADHDGIVDAQDACPNLPGVVDADPKKNGCPPDRDGDGVTDANDACIDVAGVVDANPKKNGCPSDRDDDGVWDKDDACVDVKGIASPKAEFNGCPADLDADTVKNEDDACPREPGKPNADPKKNGCPTAYIAQGSIQILDQVKFKTSSADILPGKDSEEILQAVLTILKDHPEIAKLSIEGHTDSAGNPQFNKTLSANRAASVVKWLVGHGIDKARLSSAGFGPDHPIADNKTEDGRRLNRRVEFHIVTGNGTSTTIQTPPKP